MLAHCWSSKHDPLSNRLSRDYDSHSPMLGFHNDWFTSALFKNSFDGAANEAKWNKYCNFFCYSKIESKQKWSIIPIRKRGHTFSLHCTTLPLVTVRSCSSIASQWQRRLVCRSRRLSLLDRRHGVLVPGCAECVGAVAAQIEVFRWKRCESDRELGMRLGHWGKFSSGAWPFSRVEFCRVARDPSNLLVLAHLP